MKIRESVEGNKWLFLIVSLTALGILAYMGLHPKEFTLGSKVALILIACLAGWFLDIFTGEATKRKVEQMVAFCYVFPFALFAGILIPLFAYPVALPDPPKPIGIILGCSVPPQKPENRDLVPDGIRCYNQTDQWLINIGGRVIPAEDHRPRENPSIRTAPAAELPAPGESAPAENSAVAAGTASLKASAFSRKETEEKAKEKEKRFVIEGGLVVPLYFVILAIFGGFVSMLRRVPEYQERVSSGASDPLSYERAREKLVFEVLQLLSAPLIAITAYYLIDPTSRASSIALAFIAGFSSETVLLYVRALAEKLQPQTTRKALEVEINPTSLDFRPQSVGSDSAPQFVTLMNRSSAALTGTVTVAGEFGSVPHGAFTVAPGSSISFGVTFKPTTPGDKAGQLRIKDNGPGSPREVHLSGTGI